MLLFRSLSLGLIAACFLLQIEHKKEVVAPPVITPSVATTTPPAADATIIDVSGALSPEHLPSLVRLRGDEHVVAVDDRAVASDLEAGAAIANHAKRYIDLTVRSDASARRVLMVLH